MIESDITQRKLIYGVFLVTVALVAVTITSLTRGGRPDPPALRAAAALLDGPWRFHTGDVPHWASAALDDSAWEQIDLTAPPGSHDGDVGLPDYVNGWMAHGYPGYTGYAWYRRAIDLPAGPQRWVILGPSAVEDGYELYWDGTLLGGLGRIGTNPRLVGVKPLRFTLPTDAAGKHGVLAIRVFMLTRVQVSKDGGGMRSPPIIAPQPIADGLYRAHWKRTIAGYIADAIEPLAMIALIGLVAFCWRTSSHRQFLVFASVALALTALRRLNNATVSWTDLMDLTTYSWMAKYLAAPTVAAWLLAWNRWSSRPRKAIDATALILALTGVIGIAAKAPAAVDASRYAAIALFVFIGARIAQRGPMRTFATTVLGLLVLAAFGGELLDPIGVPGIWFPFGIGVSRTQYMYAFILPLLAILIAWTSPSAGHVARGSKILKSTSQG